MKAFLTIIDDSGKQIVDHEFDPAHPSQFRAKSGERITMGQYEYFGFTYQPHVRVTAPAGYIQPLAPNFQVTSTLQQGPLTVPAGPTKIPQEVKANGNR